MSLIEDFKRYRDRFGMNQLTSTNGRGDASQNGALFTMEYIICLLEDKDTPETEKVKELARLLNVYRSLEFLPGLSRRTPESIEGDSVDNNGSNLVFSAMFDGRDFAKRMKKHGENVVCERVDETQGGERNQKYYLLARLVTFTQVVWRPTLWRSWLRSGLKPKYYWNNTKPSEFCVWGWYGRSPGFMGKVDLAAQGYTTPFRWLSVLVGQFLGAFSDPGNTDARKLPYVTWYFLTKGTGPMQRWFWKLTYKLWVKILMRQYPNGMVDVYDKYYQDSKHPIKTYSKPYFEV